jgi:hypothetical protein
LVMPIGVMPLSTEAFLRKILQRVLSVPQEQIRKTRGALFTYLVGQGYGKGNSRD